MGRQGLERLLAHALILYAGAMFHAMRLTPQHDSQAERFEIDGVNAARDFLKARAIAPGDIDWSERHCPAHHAPPRIPLVTAGVEMNALGDCP
ncbi:hypothetical protein [Inquilinus limosus]|uniref:Uncharacterized protein n=1 Tax=Inquilinus limosus TaxID=171674 RepID=A0A211ZV73_9PROT|nr:hypothetical protein [Inquilinus limosus]OWJ69056.1 hypothetical protein BWR60_00465 [Inquilinus limosus]